mgnify:CR=1 FL=1
MTMLLLGETPNAVFHDDDRAIDDDAEVESTEAHQVAADFRADHAGDGEQHRKRDDAGGEQRGAEVPQQQKQDDNDERGSFKEVLLHGLDGGVHECGAVINGVGLHAFRQRAVHFY